MTDGMKEHEPKYDPLDPFDTPPLPWWAILLGLAMVALIIVVVPTVCFLVKVLVDL